MAVAGGEGAAGDASPGPAALGRRPVAPRNSIAEDPAAWYPAVAMRDNIRLVSSAGTGFTYYTTKNKRKQTNKIEFKKYDPVVRQHVVFKEQKMPPHSK